jgi:hypothetical protein
VDPVEVENVQTKQDFEFPPGYKECVCQLGYGTLSHIVDILDPENCIKGTTILRDSVKDYWSEKAKEIIGSSWLVGYAVGGKTLVYNSSSRTIFSLDDIYEAEILGEDYLEVLGTICYQHEGRRLIFHPFQRRERFVFNGGEAHNNKDFDVWFESLRSVFLDVAKHDYWEGDGNAGDPNREATIYYPDFGGCVSMFKGGAGVSLLVSRDKGASHRTLDAVFEVARAQGYGSPKPHPHD